MVNSKSIISSVLCFLLTTVTVLAVDERDDWLLLFRPGILDSEVTYGEFIKCLETAVFPEDSGPRKVSSLLISEGVKVTVNNRTLKFITASDNSAVLIKSISYGDEISSSQGEKIQIVALFFQYCPMMIEKRQEQAKQAQAEREQYERERQEIREKERIERERVDKESELKRAEEMRKRQEDIEQRQAKEAQKKRELDEWVEAYDKSLREKLERLHDKKARKK